MTLKEMLNVCALMDLVKKNKLQKPSICSDWLKGIFNKSTHGQPCDPSSIEWSDLNIDEFIICIHILSEKGILNKIPITHSGCRKKVCTSK
jgi:hypothetical protein